jgi:hypothetical protein
VRALETRAAEEKEARDAAVAREAARRLKTSRDAASARAERVRVEEEHRRRKDEEARALGETRRERRRAEVYALNRLMCASELAALMAFMRVPKPGFNNAVGPGKEEPPTYRKTRDWSDVESDAEDACEPLPQHLRV